jgi:hypothetical protein
MRLDLRLTHRFLDQLWCQAIVAFLFEDDSLHKGYLSKINETLAGSLTSLIEGHFITGRRDELILIAPQERIKAKKLLLVGLGPTGSYSAEILLSVMRKVSSTLEKLKLFEFAILVPWAEEITIDYHESIKTLIEGFVECYAMDAEQPVNFFRTVIVSIEEKVFSDLKSLEHTLRTYLDARIEYSIAIDRNRG